MSEHIPDRLKKERSRFETADLHPDDTNKIREFDKKLSRRNKTGDDQHANLLQCIRLVAEHRVSPNTDKAHCSAFHTVFFDRLLTDRDAAEEVLDWINAKTHNGEPISEKTRTHYRGAVRMFGRVLTDHGPRGDKVPPAIQVIPGGDPRQKSEKDVAPRPSEIHWWDPDVIRLLNCSEVSTRYQALIALAWDSGARPTELISLTWADISEDQGFYRITVGGKNHPQRDPLCVVATPYLRQWVEFDHPTNESENRFRSKTPIWTHYDKIKPLRIGTVRKSIRDFRKDLDIRKPLTLKWFRKSRASIIAARPNIGQTDLENRFGWVRGSQVAAHYIARFSDSTDATVGEGDGLPEGILDRENDEREDPAPVQCPNCENWTPRHLTSCMFCGVKVDPEELEDADVKAILQKETAHREKRNEFMRHVAKDNIDPEKLEFAVRFGDFLSDNEEAVEAARELRNALDNTDD